jgi:hypothetical protein
MHRISSSGQDPNPDTVNINFDQYPSWKYQNHNFSEFNTLYNKIKSEIGKQTTLPIPDYTSIKETIYGKNIFKTEKLYNTLKKRLGEYIKYINECISFAAKKKKTGTQIDKKGNPLLVQQFIKIRKNQPECNQESYKIPGFFTSVNLPPLTGTNSLTLNKQIMSEISNCFDYLKSHMEHTFKVASGINYPSIKLIITTSLNTVLNTEFKQNNTSNFSSSYSYQSPRYGGSRKKVKFNISSKKLTHKKYKKLTIRKRKSSSTSL